MILRKLSIFGFKSFADRSDLEFGEGITSVVGPNGCGKSNVVDAIRWVFGEQKASALRSTSMQDVIFSGTQNRQPLNFAEVTITIENDKGILPVEFSEVAITRRAYRNGESEYRINKTPCRLRDISDMFLDTGIGSNAYTTIENNMINTILSDKAEERRILFEEAAGVGKYKQRRKESLRKLEYTRLDLAHINDKVVDKDRDVRALARQVEKASRYRKWYDELRSLEIGFESTHYASLKGAMAERKAQLDELDAAHESLRARMAADESKVEQMNLQVLEKENAVQIAARAVSDENEKIVSIDKDCSVSEENVKHLRENIARFEDEARSLEEQIGEKAKLRMGIEKSIVEHQTLLQKHEEQLAAVQAELAGFDAEMSVRREHADGLSVEQINLINAVGEQRNAISGLQNELRNNLDLRERHEREVELLTAQNEECKERLQECEQQLQSACEQHQNLLGSREVLCMRIEKEDGRYHQLLDREKQLEAQIDSGKSQLAFLKGLDAQFEGYESGVKALLTVKSPGNLGIAAGLITVDDERMAGIVDRVLGVELQTVVFTTDEDLRTAVNYLRKEEVGSARLVSLERLAKCPAPRAFAPGDRATGLRGCVTTAEEHRVLADHLFGRVMIAPSPQDAMDLSLQAGPDAIYATEDGVVCLSDGTVIAGSVRREHAGILMRKQRIGNLPAAIEALQKEYQRIVHEKEICIITRDEAKMALAEVNEKLSTGQRRQQEQETNIKHYHNDWESVNEKLVSLRRELAGVAARTGTLEESLRGALGVLEQLQAKSADLERQLEVAKADVSSREEQRSGITEKVTNAQLRLQGDRHKLAQSAGDVKNLTTDIGHLTDRQHKLLEERQSATTRVSDLTARVASLKQVLEEHRIGREALQGRLAEVREDYNGILNEIEALRQHVKEDRATADDLSARIGDLRNLQARAEEKMRALREKMFEAYKVDLEAPPADVAPPSATDAEVDETIKMYKERLNHLTGQVNMAAPEEYETKSKELRDLTTQRDDLQAAVDDLERAIKKLNKEARVKFVETFEQVKANFTRMFTTLFEGGEVHLSLDESVDPLEAPIHINARPAGKKMRGVQLLSGGERALTAISLLFALYMVKPSAYCILDELDAPLDDANIERFVRAVRQFSEQTQFIIITHNKRTMEAADVLYGVTQQEKGVSTIVSVRIEEAMRHAA